VNQAEMWRMVTDPEFARMQRIRSHRDALPWWHISERRRLKREAAALLDAVCENARHAGTS
jgi:hypothetical protein